MAQGGEVAGVFLTMKAVSGAAGEVLCNRRGLLCPDDGDSVGPAECEQALGLAERGGNGIVAEGEGFAGALDAQVNGGKAGDGRVD